MSSDDNNGENISTIHSNTNDGNFENKNEKYDFRIDKISTGDIMALPGLHPNEIFLAIQNEKSFGGDKRRKGKKGDDNGSRCNLFDDADWSDDEKDGIMNRVVIFDLHLHHFMPMADFYDDGFDRQSKRTLYERVDKDSSQIIESYELSSFLYYAIAIYINQHGDMLNEQTIRPLKELLLANKIVDTVGLSFDEFDHMFSSWV